MNDDQYKIKPDGDGMTAFRPKTTEEYAAEQKSRKRELVAAAIGDGISSLSNLFFATKGAPSISPNKEFGRVSLTEMVKQRHREQNERYETKLSEWDKQQKELKKQIEERAEIHENFNPLFSTWNNKDFIDYAFEKLKESVSIYDIYAGKEHGGTPIEEFINRFDVSGNAGKYIKREILTDILSGDYGYEDEEYIDKLRSYMQGIADDFVPIK